MSFNRIVVAVNPQVDHGLQEAAQMVALLQTFGAEVAHGLLDDPDLQERVHAREFDLLIALGGDGTMLRAGHLCAPVNTPVLGVNLGHFGFLTEIQQGDWQEALPRLFSGQVWFETRMMLRAELWRGEEFLGVWEVVNEAFIGHGQIIRPVHLVANVDERYLTTYVADGIIVATPTGSTAYALAAGGPILPPELRNILLVPVAPHLSIDRAVVLSEGSSVSVGVLKGNQPVLSIDGQEPIPVRDGDRVVVCASDHNVRFARLQDPAYFYSNITLYMNRNPAVM